MNLTYLHERQKQKLGQAFTDQQKRASDKENGNKAIPAKSLKKIEAEKEAKKSKEMTLGQFFETMIACAPEYCMETGERLIFKIAASEVVCHILPKKPTAVPSMAKNPLNIVYLNIDTHKKMDADMGVKSLGKFVTAMKIFPLLKERVALMWPNIPRAERKNVPPFLRPDQAVKEVKKLEDKPSGEYIEYEEIKP